jgi:hypothetical protein
VLLWRIDPLLSGDSGAVNTSPLLGSVFLIMQQLDATIEECVFYVIRAEMLQASDTSSCQ